MFSFGRVTILVSVAATFIGALPPMATAAEPIAVPMAVAAVTVDGVLDDSVWQVAPAVDVDTPRGAATKPGDAPRMTAHFAWDYHYLYIAYEVDDTQVVALTDGRVKGPPGNRRQAALPWAPEKRADVAEFFVSFGSTRYLWELQHNAANHFNDVFLNVLDPAQPEADTAMAFLGLIMNEQEFVKDDGAFTVKTAVTMKPTTDGTPSTINYAADVDTGYVAEMRFPWKGLGAPVSARKAARRKALPAGAWDMAGRQLSILAVILNGNAGPNYCHNRPGLPAKGMFATHVRQFPVYRLAPAD